MGDRLETSRSVDLGQGSYFHLTMDSLHDVEARQAQIRIELTQTTTQADSAKILQLECEMKEQQTIRIAYHASDSKGGGATARIKELESDKLAAAAVNDYVAVDAIKAQIAELKSKAAGAGNELVGTHDLASASIEQLVRAHIDATGQLDTIHTSGGVDATEGMFHCQWLRIDNQEEEGFSLSWNSLVFPDCCVSESFLCCVCVGCWQQPMLITGADDQSELQNLEEQMWHDTAFWESHDRKPREGIKWGWKEFNKEMIRVRIAGRPKKTLAKTRITSYTQFDKRSQCCSFCCFGPCDSFGIQRCICCTMQNPEDLSRAHIYWDCCGREANSMGCQHKADGFSFTPGQRSEKYGATPAPGSNWFHGKVKATDSVHQNL